MKLDIRKAGQPYLEELPILHHYSGSDSHQQNPINEACLLTRIGLQEKKKEPIPKSVIENAVPLIAAARAELEIIADRFGQVLSHDFYSQFALTHKSATGDNGHLRVVMLVEGNFNLNTAHRDTIPTCLPVDLEGKVHNLFIPHQPAKTNGSALQRKNQKTSTRDREVTIGQTQEYLNVHAENLHEQGISEFEIGSSKFFYSDVATLAEKGLITEAKQLNFLQLVPLIVPVSHVLLEQVKSVERFREGEYAKRAPPLASYRLKGVSLIDKMFETLINSPAGNIRREELPDGTVKEHATIYDWLAYRLVFPSHERVEAFKESLGKDGRQIGDYYVRPIFYKDYYNAPKQNGYKALHLIAEITAGINGHRAVVEIQLVDQRQYFYNELSQSAASHRRHKGKQERAYNPNNEIHRYYYVKLADMLGGIEPITIQF